MRNILAERIQERLKAMGINATNAALNSGLGKTAVRDIIAGKSKSPTVATLAALAGTLECTVSYLLGDAIHPAGFRETDAQIKNVRIVPVMANLSSGNFSKTVSSIVETFGRGIAYDSRDFGPSDLLLSRAGDDSMEAVGIMKGDVVTSVTRTIDAPLRNGDIVTVVRYIDPPGIKEESLRQVQINKDGTTSLCTRPIDGEGDEIILDRQIKPGSETQRWLTAEGHGIMITGIVTRLVRDFPENG